MSRLWPHFRNPGAPKHAPGTRLRVMRGRPPPPKNASAGNRTRVTSIATTYSTTRPLMLTIASPRASRGRLRPAPLRSPNVHCRRALPTLFSLHPGSHATAWPSGLRRQLKALVRKGVGSNPTAVILGGHKASGPNPQGERSWRAVGALAQLVARRSHNPKVVSSILTGPSFSRCWSSRVSLSCVGTAIMPAVPR